MKKVAIIGTAGVPARYGGFETLAHQLSVKLHDQFKLHMYCSTVYYPKEERQRYWKGVRLHYLPLNANGIQSILYDILSIFHALFYADALIVLGVSGGIVLPLVKFFTRKNIIVNIDGLEWRRDKWSKPIKKFLKLSEYLAVRYSDADITDNLAIKKYTAIYYKTLSHLIEYGADHVVKPSITRNDIATYPFLSTAYAFKVCRIEPENNLHLVLGSFSQLPNNHLVIVGNWNNSEYGQGLKEQYGELKNIHLLDPIYDQRALDILRSNCYVYIHGHSAGGTNPSLVEAMYLELPVIAFDISYNRATTEDQAYYFKNEQELVSMINSKSLNDYLSNSKRMKEIANRRYTWERIAMKYQNLINVFDYNYVKRSVFSTFRNMNTSRLLQAGSLHMKNTRMFYET